MCIANLLSTINHNQLLMIREAYKYLDLSEHAYLVCFSVKEAISPPSLQNTREIPKPDLQVCWTPEAFWLEYHRAAN